MIRPLNLDLTEDECLAIYVQAQREVAASRGLPDPSRDPDYKHNGGAKPARPVYPMNTMRGPQMHEKSVEELAQELLAAAGLGPKKGAGQ